MNLNPQKAGFRMQSDRRNKVQSVDMPVYVTWNISLINLDEENAITQNVSISRNILW